jgi:hypothetical protein
MPFRRRESEEPLLPPGWYDDLDTGGRRYFDGEEWSPTVMEMLHGGTGRSLSETRWSWGSRLALAAVVGLLLTIALFAFASVMARWEREPPLTFPSETVSPAPTGIPAPASTETPAPEPTG